MIVRKEDISFTAARSHKPGGRNRDHRSTKVHAWVKIAGLPLKEKQKRLIRSKLAHHINHEDALWVECQETRSQELNLDHAVEHLNTLLEGATHENPPRIPTEPPRTVEDVRIRRKKLHSRKKHVRHEGHIPSKDL